MSFWSCSHACWLRFQLEWGPGMDQKLSSTSLMRHLRGCEDLTPLCRWLVWSVWSLGLFHCSSLSLAPCSTALAFARLALLSAALLGCFSIPQLHLLHYMGPDSSSPSLSDLFPLPQQLLKSVFDQNVWQKQISLPSWDLKVFLVAGAFVRLWAYKTDLNCSCLYQQLYPIACGFLFLLQRQNQLAN